MLNAGNVGATYLWNNGATTQTITVSAARTFTVTVTNAGGCTNTGSTTISILNAPTTAVQAAICAGQAFSFNGQTLTAPGTYTAMLQSFEGCDSTVTLTLTVNPLPSVNAGTDTTLCKPPASIQLVGTPANGTWSTGGGIGVTLTPAGLFSAASGTTLGNYPVTYTFTGANGCSNTDVVVVKVDLCTGTDDLALAGVSVFPNPTDDVLNVRLPEILAEPAQLALFNTAGQLVLEDTNGVENLRTLDVSQLPAGLYLLRVRSGAAVVSFRVMVQ
jgi:hypothetical protein